MSTRNITLNFSPYPEQREVLESPARFRAVAAGRRSGKTLMAAAETVRRALEGEPGWRGYWVGAEHHHAKTAYELIDNVLPDEVVERRNRSPPRTIDLVDDRTIEFHTAGGGALVSIGLDWAVCDEAAKEFPERSWVQELRPALSDRNGAAMFISTPDGRGWFHERWQRGQSDEYDSWRSWRWSSYANPHVADSEIDDAREDTPDRIFEQEYLAQFIDETGGVFEGLDKTLFTTEWDLPDNGVPPERHVADDYSGPIAQKPYSIGADLARHQDYRVIVVVDGAGQVVYFDREQGETWPQIQRAIESTADRYPGLVSIDASRDNKLVADLEASGVQIEPVKFSAQRKQDLIETLVATVEAGDLSAPEIDPLRHELEVFEYDVSRAGNIRYHAPEGFHDDTVDAFALAVDGMDKTGGAAATTARIGGHDEESDGDGLDGIVQEQARQRFNTRWK